MSGRSGRCFLKVLCGSIEPIKPQVAQGYLKPSASLLTGMLPAAHTSDLYLYLFLSLSLPSEWWNACFPPHPSTASLCHTNSY